MTAFFNTGLTQQQFLDQYWQKKPLLIKQGFPDFISPISAEELAGLACEEEIESRLIQQQLDAGQWQVMSGPFTESDFTALPKTHWTLLVQDVDKHIAEFQKILDPFRFIPDWRRDDIMVSYAPESGSVGPHTDSYDVFLVQAQGSRRWHIENKENTSPNLMADCDLKIITDFSADEVWDLEAGDILYLPPHFSHHGVALGDCMTFSVGFRSPRLVEVLDGFVNNLLEAGLDTTHYADPNLAIQYHSHQIEGQTIERVKAQLHQLIDKSDGVLTDALGKLLTETKPSLEGFHYGAMSEVLSQDELGLHFEQGHRLQRNRYCRLAWSQTQQGTALFLAGERYTLDNTCNEQLAVMLCESKYIDGVMWQQIKLEASAVTVLTLLIAEGAWYWAL